MPNFGIPQIACYVRVKQNPRVPLISSVAVWFFERSLLKPF